jgi:hypothetical protein
MLQFLASVLVGLIWGAAGVIFVMDLIVFFGNRERNLNPVQIKRKYLKLIIFATD